jgi:tuftelin-interacting protein 11
MLQVDRDFGDWEKHTKGVGMKLLERMGYRKGMGIGRDGEGLVNPVQAKLRVAKKGGLGFGGDERTEQQKQDDREKGREYVDEEAKIKEEIKLWKKGIEPGTQQPQVCAVQALPPGPFRFVLSTPRNVFDAALMVSG